MRLQQNLSMNESGAFGTLALMKTTGERIHHIRKLNNLTQTQFANRIGGVSRGAVGNWELNSAIKRDNLVRISELFGVSFDWLATGRGAPPGDTQPVTPPPPNAPERGNASPPEPRPISPRRMIPVYGRAVGGSDGRFVMNGQKVAEVFAPAELEHVPDAYAVYVHGSSMQPRYFPGEGVWVHPHRPVRAGDFVVAQIAGPEGEPPSAFVKQFVSIGAELVLEQMNPPPGEGQTLRFPAEQVVSVHRIIGSFGT